MNEATCKALTGLVFERIEIGTSAAENYSEYQEAEREKEALFDELEKQVGFKAISRFADACCRVYSLEFITLYFQGLRDGALLAKVGDMGNVERIVTFLEAEMLDNKIAGEAV
jgi:hypothetical protein